MSEVSEEHILEGYKSGACGVERAWVCKVEGSYSQFVLFCIYSGFKAPKATYTVTNSWGGTYTSLMKPDCLSVEVTFSVICLNCPLFLLS